MKKGNKKPACSMFRGQPSESIMDLSSFMIYKISQYISESFEDFFAAGPVKARHFCILRVLVKENSMSQQQLCEALWIDRATMVGAVQLMVDLGFLKKRQHPEDKRSYIVSVTTKGQAFYKKHHDGFASLDQKIFSELQENEMKQFKVILRKSMSSMAKANSK